MRKTPIVGPGNMGRSHALARQATKGRRSRGSEPLAPGPVDFPESYPLFDSLEAIRKTRPDLVVNADYSDGKAGLAIRAKDAGAHVLVEKPLATTVGDAGPWWRRPGD